MTGATSKRARLLLLAFVPAALVALASRARAGGGPETTVVVVNARDPGSVRVAGAYVRLRDIPPTHVLYLDDVPSDPVVDVERFRAQILAPLEQWLASEGIEDDTEVVAYSTGFPYAVDFDADAKAKDLKLGPPISPHASLTGLTFLYRYVLASDPRSYLDLQANHYFRRDGRDEVPASRAFSAASAWDASGDPVVDRASPDRYRLAVMLGWTGDHGNTEDEVISCLERAKASDFTNPRGTVYLLENPDIRATTRMPLFEAVVKALRGLGHRAEILKKGEDGQDGVLPRGKADAIGVVAGIAGFTWQKGDPDLLPGAIAEHLTSFGAHFGTSSQTKCTEFVRHGAAGTSGTVAEPYAIPNKFPCAWMHLHYARGCSLAEAFYEGVWGPYQLLVLGDPLARPFARPTAVRIGEPRGDAPVQGRVEVRAETTPPEHARIARLELWVDGVRVATAEPPGPLAWDTTTGADGAHDVRVVAVESGPIATRSYARALVGVQNGASRLEAEAPSGPVEIGRPLVLSGTAREVRELSVRRGSQVVATAAVSGPRWRVEVPTAALGLGRSTLLVLGTGAEGRGVVSAPLVVEVQPPTSARPAATVEEGLLLEGLLATVTDAEKKEHEGVVGSLAAGGGRTLAADLGALGVPAPARVVLDGLFRAPAGLARIGIVSGGAVRLLVDGETVLDAAEALAAPGPEALLSLAAGWHRIRIEADGRDLERLQVSLGGSRPAAPLAGADLAYEPAGRALAERPGTATLGEGGSDARGAVDGKREGGTVDVPADGLVLGWPRTEHHVVAVVLHAAGSKPPSWPSAWVVETRSSPRGPWRKVHGLELRAGPVRAPPGAKKGATWASWVELSFQATSPRAIRLRPAGDASPVRITEAEVHVRAARH